MSKLYIHSITALELTNYEFSNQAITYKSLLKTSESPPGGKSYVTAGENDVTIQTVLYKWLSIKCWQLSTNWRTAASYKRSESHLAATH